MMKKINSHFKKNAIEIFNKTYPFPKLANDWAKPPSAPLTDLNRSNTLVKFVRKNSLNILAFAFNSFVSMQLIVVTIGLSPLFWHNRYNVTNCLRMSLKDVPFRKSVVPIDRIMHFFLLTLGTMIAFTDSMASLNNKSCDIKYRFKTTVSVKREKCNYFQSNNN